MEQGKSGGIRLLVEELRRYLVSSCKTVAVAESCTGGALATALTAEAGASKFFRGAAVVYCNEAKSNVLGVNESLIEHHTAVSCEVAEEMASRVRCLFRADYALSTTGFAGPDGGTDTIPVGTICIGLASRQGSRAVSLRFEGSRSEVIGASVAAAIGCLLDYLAIDLA